MRRLFLLCIGLAASCPVFATDSRSLVGIHWWGYYDFGVVDPQPAQLLQSATVENGHPVGAWNLEVVNTHGPAWQNASFFQPLYNDLYSNKKVSLITRVEYEYGKTVPAPTTINSLTWANNHVVPLINTLRHGGRWWQLGNEPNIIGEGVDWTDGKITPAGYAQIYKDVRHAVANNAQVGAPGAHKVLVAPVSPGGVIPGIRWMDGNQWLGEAIDAIKALNSPIDGIAIHAYGGTVHEFRASIASQLSVIEAKGLSDVPVFLTEWNRFANPTAPDAAQQEAASAEFARRALRAIDDWNKTPGNHNIVGTNWFVYDSGDRNNTASGPWAGYSIKYWGTAGNPHGHPGDLLTAFEHAVAQRYQAGIHGTIPIASSIQILDNFEASSGHFNKSLTFASSGSRFGFDTSTSHVIRHGEGSYSKAWGQKLQINHNGDSRGWQVRHVSGDSLPASNEPITIPLSGNEAYLGFFLRTTTPGIKVQIIVDSDGNNGGVHTDAGRLLDVIADDHWHLYEWNLLNASDWVPFALATGSDGIIAGRGGYVTLDSIMFYGPTASATIWFDFVAMNSKGSLNWMQGIPEPTAIAPLMLLGAHLATRRRRQTREA